MNRITLITGGCRSGKSSEALRMALECAAAQRTQTERTFFATSPRFSLNDEEMNQRILRHQKERLGMGFETVEVPLDLKGAFRKLQGPSRESGATQTKVVVVDCISLWVSNLMIENDKTETEETLQLKLREVLSSAQALSGEVFFVTNEVGLGIVPENRLARRFRDLLGRANQEIAKVADAVILKVSGLSIRVK